ncbi:MAG: ATP-binding protein [Clostridiaceae bacterium]
MKNAFTTSRLNIFTGHFGSGKTETSINFALKLAESGDKVSLVDIDIVNPYFCSRDIKEELEEKGLRIIAASKDLSNGELMVVPGEVISAFNDKSHRVVFDIGGDDMGAVALGQYNRYFLQEDYNMYLVINNNRPLTETIEACEEYLYSIERSSRLKVTHLVSNTNLSSETTTEDVIKGDSLVSELSHRLRLPHAFTVCTKDQLFELEGRVKGNLFPIDIYMKKPWER